MKTEDSYTHVEGACRLTMTQDTQDKLLSISPDGQQLTSTNFNLRYSSTEQEAYCWGLDRVELNAGLVKAIPGRTHGASFPDLMKKKPQEQPQN